MSMSLRGLFYPRGVALVGSTTEGKLGYQIIQQLLKGGFTRIYAVNPKAKGAMTPSFTSSSRSI
jgi:acyl-CoA synthetase (NDP forming)